MRSKSRPRYFDAAKFKALYRYVVRAAMDKRCVPYIELQDVFAISRAQIGYYAGQIGYYCLEDNEPLLNALIITVTTCAPSHGFDWFAEQRDKDWGALVQECWKRFHVATARKAEAQNFAGVEPSLDTFLRQGNRRTD